MASQAITLIGSSSSQPTSERLQPIRLNTPAPARLARVPSRLTAPSVPGGTTRNRLKLMVVRPQRLPISLPQVSPSLAAKLATKPTINRGVGAPGTWLSSARAVPVAAEPQTFSGPRRPPRASAIPSSALRAKPSLVTAEPRPRYSTTASQPCQPSVAPSTVPKAQACHQPLRVSTGTRVTGRISPALIRALMPQAVRAPMAMTQTLPSQAGQRLILKKTND